MGVRNLWDILDSCKKTLPLHHLQNKRVCIDLSCWMVQLQNVNRTHCAIKEKLYLRGLFHRIRALIAFNCSLIFVTDGAIPAVKISTYRKRLNLADEGTKDDVNGQKVSSLRRNMGSEFSCMVREAKTLGMALGIPCLDGIEEAEAQCAFLNSESICDGCFTSDSDVFLFGARTVYRDICLGDGGYVVCYEMTDIEKKLGLGRHSLIALALLLGSDYSHGVHGFGPELACQVVRSIGEDIFLKRIASDGVSFLKSLKPSKKQGRFPNGGGKENLPPYQQQKAIGNQQNLEGDNEFLRVIDAYMKPKCHPVDSDPVYRVLATYPFKCAELQQLCDQFFDWPPEKTDEYILPRIAERELRKFANLRSSSSQLGAVLPLHEMPIKCPISEVLKRRRVQGKECFEVSWEEFDGLKTSVVPADLVESACPEKIVEFEEKKAQKRKQSRPKPKSKKSDEKASMANVDLKLQKLLLEIESKDNARKGHSLYPVNSSAMSSSSSDASMTPGAFLNACTTTRMEMDVIDLLSPMPKKSEYKDASISMANCNLKIQESVLEEVESEDMETRMDSCPCTSIPPRSTSKNDSMISGTFVDQQYDECRIANEPRSDCHSDMEMDVIDLLSPAPKKLEHKAALMASINLEHQDQRNDSRRDSPCSTSTSTSTSGSSRKDDSLFLNKQDEGQIRNEPPSDCCLNSVEMEMVDLLSPSPEPRARYVSKCQGSNNAEDLKTAIDLSDSDVEMSPEHARKARELRVFLDSIRVELD